MTTQTENKIRIRKAADHILEGHSAHLSGVAVMSETSVKLFPGQDLCHAIDLGCIRDTEHRQQRLMPFLASAIEAELPCAGYSLRRAIGWGPHLSDVVRCFFAVLHGLVFTGNHPSACGSGDSHHHPGRGCMSCGTKAQRSNRNQGCLHHQSVVATQR